MYFEFDESILGGDVRRFWLPRTVFTPSVLKLMTKNVHTKEEYKEVASLLERWEEYEACYGYQEGDPLDYLLLEAGEACDCQEAKRCNGMNLSCALLPLTKNSKKKCKCDPPCCPCAYGGSFHESIPSCDYCHVKARKLHND